MTAHIEQVPLWHVVCTDHGELTPPMDQPASYFEDIASKHNAQEHTGFNPEGEDG